eukprot:scpid77768/ scgid25049/ Peptidyl-tRNA hydrolase ICT1, mitochondrial; Immature colon carcinoma transcript 1 protein homolog
MAWVSVCSRSVLFVGLRTSTAQHHPNLALLQSRSYLKLPEIPPLPESYDGSMFKGPIPMDKISRRFSLSQGAGGQCVQKTDSKACIYFKLDEADWLPLWIRDRMRSMFKKRMNKDGEFSISCEESRSQAGNLEKAQQKLKAMIVEASELPDKPYKSTIKAAKQHKKSVDRKSASSKRHQKIKEEKLAKYADAIEAAKAAKEAVKQAERDTRLAKHADKTKSTE